MASVSIQRVTSSADYGRFIRAAHTCQGHDPYWIAPLHFMERDRLSSKKNPWFTHGDAAFWIAERDGRPVGRISAQIDHSHVERRDDATGFFGFFDCVDDQDIAN